MSVSIIIEGIQGKLKGEKWIFEDSSIIRIGRHPENDIVIPKDETGISRQQCEIRVNDREVVIVDKDGKSASPAGTWIDNKKIASGENGFLLGKDHLLGMGTAGNTELFKIVIERPEIMDESSILSEGPVSTVGVIEPEDIEPEEPEESKKQEELDPSDAENRFIFNILKAGIRTLKDAYHLLDLVKEDDEDELLFLFRHMEYGEKKQEELDSLKELPDLHESYLKLSQMMSQDARLGESDQQEPEPLISEEDNIHQNVDNHKIEKVEDSGLDSSSIRIDLSDYDVVDIKENLVVDDKVIKDKEEDAIDHHVKLAPINVGGLKGDYKIIGGETQGGFGFVVRVQNKKTKEIFAMKEILSSMRDTDRIKWFKREVMIGQQLDHPNVVRVFEGDFQEKENKYRYLMEYCAGGDLQTYVDKLLSKGKLMKLDDAVQIMYQILDGLIYLHNAEVICYDGNGKAKKIKGLVHRDIKPKNIFLVKKNDISHVKIGDYGSLKSVQLAGDSCHTRDKVVIISDGYTPAKQSNRKENGFRYAKPPVDVFASAAIFYFLLTGKTIIRRKNKEGDVEIVPIRELNKKIPVKLAEVIDNVLLEDDIIDEDMVTSAKEFKENIMNAMKTI